MDPKEEVISTMMRKISFRAATGLALALLAVGSLPLEPTPVSAQETPAVCNTRDSLPEAPHIPPGKGQPLPTGPRRDQRV